MLSAARKTPIHVKVKFFTTLREIVGRKEELIALSDSITLEALLKQLAKTHGDDFEDYVYDGQGKVRGYLQLLINGRNLSTNQRKKTTLREGDEVAILPPVGGG